MKTEEALKTEEAARIEDAVAARKAARAEAARKATKEEATKEEATKAEAEAKTAIKRIPIIDLSKEFKEDMKRKAELNMSSLVIISALSNLALLENKI